MKIGTHEHVDIATGVQEDFDVEIEANAVAIYAQISGLAKDKVGYAIRELPTNAWDESRDNYEVHLPTPLNPVFRVRDYGRGISPENMKNVYGRLYASTKRTSNDQVGGWGLGSKSPFAYLLGPDGAGSFNVTSYHEGMMRAYVISLSAEGKIKIRLLAEMPSDEPSGLDVSYAVRREDIHTFHNRARQILWSFNPRPKIFPEIEWSEPMVLSSGEGWTNYKKHTVPFQGPHVRMGCVMYPFDLNQIETSGFLDIYDNVVFEAPIGSLKVTLSREELAYDETTKTTLKTLVASYESSFISQLTAKVDAATSFFQACHIFEQECSQLGASRENRLRQVVKWQGRYLGNTLDNTNAKFDTLQEGWSRFDKFEGTTVRTIWPVDATVVIEHNPSYSFNRFEMAGLVGKKVLWVRCKRIHREQVLANLGNPEVVDLDSFKVTLEKRTSKTIRKRKTLMVMANGATHRITQEIDIAAGGYVVEAVPVGGYRRRRYSSDFYRLQDEGAALSFSDVEQVIKTCVDFGLIEAGTVILVKSKDQVALGENWTMLADDLVDDLRSRVNVEEFTGLHKKSVNHLDSSLQELAKLTGVFRRAPEDLRQFKRDLTNLHARLRRNSTASTDTDRACAALSKLGIDIEKPEVACPIDAIQNRFYALCGEYPLLKVIIDEYHYYDRNAVRATKLKHYFELLSRPQAANDNDEADVDDVDVADIDNVQLDEAA
jgi:hypothetical protein